MPRRSIVIAAVAAACLATIVAVAPGASATPRPAPLAVPAHVPATLGGGTISGPIPQDYPPIDDPAGHTCPFAMHLEFPGNKVVAYTYTNAEGRVVAAYYTGALYMKVTRVDTGSTVTKNIGGKGIQTFASDGSSVLYGAGPFSASQHPGDTPGPELTVLHGLSAVAIAADGHKTILYSSHIENVCPELG